MAAALISAAALSPVKAPAFPGAEGHGRYVTGGRGGEVIHVTNLNDKGTGSFRAAVKGSKKKIIVFDVAGVIPLASDLNNRSQHHRPRTDCSFTRNYSRDTYTVQPESNCIIRFIRLRRGQEKNINDGADATWQRNKTGIIFDHCSFSWSIDEVASYYDNNNFTMQWCTSSRKSYQPRTHQGSPWLREASGAGKLASSTTDFIGHLDEPRSSFQWCQIQIGQAIPATRITMTYQWKNPVQAENVWISATA